MRRGPRSARPPERWSARASSRDVVRLEIPADLHDDRRFEVSVRLQVRARGGRDRASHGLRIQFDGALEWSRIAPTATDGDDGFDWRAARSVPAGRPLRIVATCELRAAERLALTIVAEEIDD